ncbi:glutamate mutase L [candidate division WOR-3 bacterium]|nr:glutamate mutase L [candidate division WOR-3 bacterium]
MILTFDIGSTLTKAMLYSQEEGEISKTIVPSDPHGDIELSAKSACYHLEKKSGVRLIDASGNFLIPTAACSSIGGGLNAVAVSSVGSISGKIAYLVLSHSGSNVIGSVSNDDGLNFQEHVQKIVALNPDIILIAGGTESEGVAPVIEAVKSVAYAARLLSPRGNLTVVFGGNSKAQRIIEQMLGGLCRLVFVPNIMPEEDMYDIYPAIDEIRGIGNEIQCSKNWGWKNFFDRLTEPLLPTSICLLKAASFAGHHRHLAVVSCGSSTTELITAELKNGNQSSVMERYSSPYGVGIKAYEAYQRFFSENTSLWLQQLIETDAVENIVRKRAAFPSISPGVFEADLLHTLAAEIISPLAEFSFRVKSCFFDNILAASYIFTASKPEKVYETLLNCIQPVGFAVLHIDEGYLANYGLIKTIDETFAYPSVLKNSCPSFSLKFNFKNPGTEIAQMIFSSNKETLTVSLKAGELKFIDSGFSEAEITVLPGKSVDAGEGPGIPCKSFVRLSENGILVDSRGRPFSPGLYGSDWFPSLQSWKKNLGLRSVL